MLDDTLVVWGGEFGRTVYCQGTLTKTNYGRDHHPRCFTIFMAGAGIKPGNDLRRDGRFRLQHYRESGTCSRPARNDAASAWESIHQRLIYKFQGRRYRLTDVHGEVVRDILS